MKAIGIKYPAAIHANWIEQDHPDVYVLLSQVIQLHG